MKMSLPKYALLKAAIKAVVEHLGPKTVRKYAKERNDKAMIWQLHRLATDQLQYDDDHPNFQKGVWPRIYPYAAGFKMYESQLLDAPKANTTGDLNDSHIETALKRIGKELGLFIGNWPK